MNPEVIKEQDHSIAYLTRMNEMRKGFLAIEKAQEKIDPYFDMLNNLREAPRFVRYIAAVSCYPLRPMISRISAQRRTLKARQDLADMGYF